MWVARNWSKLRLHLTAGIAPIRYVPLYTLRIFREGCCAMLPWGSCHWRKRERHHLRGIESSRSCECNAEGWWIQWVGNKTTVRHRVTALEHIDVLMRAANLYNAQGRFAQSGRILSNAADGFRERGYHKNAIDLYYKAAEFYELDEYGKVACSQIRMKYADLVSQYTEKYTEAIRVSSLPMYAKRYFIDIRDWRIQKPQKPASAVWSEGYLPKSRTITRCWMWRNRCANCIRQVLRRGT